MGAFDLIDKKKLQKNYDKYGLSPREREVTTLILKGYALNEAIADELGISTGTVKMHMNRIYLKTQTSHKLLLGFKLLEESI